MGWVTQSIPPELLPPKRANVAYTPYNLFDMVIAAADGLPEKKDKRVQDKMETLKTAIDRRIAALQKVK